MTTLCGVSNVPVLLEALGNQPHSFSLWPSKPLKRRRKTDKSDMLDVGIQICDMLKTLDREEMILMTFAIS